MLLRVRTPSGGTLKLRIEPTLSYADFLQKASIEAGGLPIDGLYCSLNKKDPLPALPAAPMSSTGLSSGDLVWLISPEAASVAPSAAAPQAVPTPSPLQQLVIMGFAEERARAALAQAGALDRAIDLLTSNAMDIDEAGPGAPPEPPSVPMPVPAAVPMPHGNSASSSSLADAVGQELAARPKPPVPTSLVPQSWMRALDGLLASGGASNVSEAICLLLHLQLTQAGFVLRSTQGGDVPIASARSGSGGASACTVVAPPAAWRQAPGLYSLGYAHERALETPVVTVKGVPMGPVLLLHAMVEGGGSTHPSSTAPVFSAQVPLANHARHRDASAAVRDASGLAALPKLVHLLSTSVLQPVLLALKERRFDPHAVGASTSFADLLPELQFAVLAQLDAKALARAGCVCTALRPLSTDELLWSRLYEQAYGGSPPEGATSMASFRRRFEAEAEAERQRQRPTFRDQDRYALPFPVGTLPPFHPGFPGHGPPGHDPYGSFPGPMPPGFIGGDVDRVPGGGMLPGFPGGIGPAGVGGGMRPTPGYYGGGPDGMLPAGGVPPGARFDPISPLIDQDGMHGGPGGGRFGGGPRLGPGGRGGRFGPGHLGGGSGLGPAGRGGRFRPGRGGGLDPDSPDIPDML
jgi:hypothetical protein